jgi:hypothetical protein
MSNDNDKDQEYQKNMGKRLRKIRKENALSQDDVADALGICTKQYQSINTQWMLNRINYVLVIKMESAIIESDKRLSKETVTKFEISNESVTKMQISNESVTKFKISKKTVPKFKISKKTAPF